MGILPALSEDERRMFDTFKAQLYMPERTNKVPVCIGMVGLVGSGKTTAALSIAVQLPAALVSADAIKILLHETTGTFENESYRKIILNAVMFVLEKGRNVVLDNDNVESDKRRLLTDIALRAGGRALFVHVTTALETIMGRIIDDKYGSESVFSYAPAAYDGGDHHSRAAAARLQTLFNRLPYHYTFNSRHGRWEPKAIDRSLTLTVDMASPRVETALATLSKHIRLQH